jgi:valyl-tRNA synthetase
MLNIENYKGLKIKEARKKILEDLEKENLIVEQKDITHVVNVHDKCGVPIEILATEQWFIKILDKKKKFIEQGRKINWSPQFMRKRYENWVNGLDWDWNISRNRHFGVPIPVWECKKCKEIILAEEKELPVDPLQLRKKCPKCGGKAEGESMVLDTWATSSLSPQIASSLVKGKVKIPFSLRPQGHDIIRTWAFYTIVKSCLHENKIPWKDIIITGNVSLKGEKMSKSKGNVISPQEVLGKFSVDSLRFWAAGSKLGNDLDYQEKDLVTGEKFTKKLINASKFVFMNLEDYKGERPKKLEKIDELFLTKVSLLVQRVTKNFENYEYSKAKLDVEQFFWSDFCNNYLEIVKKRIYQGKGEKRLSAQYALYKSLLIILKLIAPIMPFITEEIYQEHFKKFEKEKSIHVCEWPKAENLKQKNLDEVSSWRGLVETIEGVRKWKTKKQKSMNSECIITIPKKNKTGLRGMLEDFKSVTNAKEIKEGKFKVEFI